MIDDLDLAYLNSLEFGFRLAEILERADWDGVMQLTKEQISAGPAHRRAVLMRQLECETLELVGYLAALDAMTPERVGSTLAELIDLDLDVEATASLSEKADVVRFSFSRRQVRSTAGGNQPC